MNIVSIKQDNLNQTAKAAPKKTKMKKVLLGGILGVFMMGMVGCGSGHACDAYRKADYTKYKADHNQKIEMVQELLETSK